MKTARELQSEINELSARLAEAEETLRAIRSGEVDALVVSTPAGEQVYTLQSADYVYRILVENMAEGALILDSEGKVLYCNASFAALLKQPAQKVIWTALSQWITPADREPFEEQLKCGLQDGCNGELTLLAGDSTTIPVYFSFSPLKLDTPVTYVIVTDLSERKRAMEALKESEERFRLLADHSSDLISRHTIDAEFRYASPASRDLLGCAPDELTNSSLYEFVHPDDLTQLINALTTVLAWPAAITFSYRLRRKNGDYVWVELTGWAIRDEKSGKPLEIQLDTRNISKRKQSETEIKRRSRELAMLNRISLDASQTLDADEILARLKVHLIDEFGILAGAIYLYNPKSSSFELKHTWGRPEPGKFEAPAADASSLQKILDRPVVFTPFAQHPGAENQAGLPAKPQRGMLSVAWIGGGSLQGLAQVIIEATPDGIEYQAETFQTLANEVGAAVKNAQLYQAEQESRRLAETLRSSGKILVQTLEMETVLSTLLELINEVVPFDCGVVYLAADDGHFNARAGRGFDAGMDLAQIFTTRARILHGAGTRELIAAGKSVLVADTAALADWKLSFSCPDLRCWMGIPLMAGKKMLGFCGLEKDEPDFFTSEHIRWVEALASQAVVAIQNAWLFEQVRGGREKLQSLTRRLVQVQEQERRYVAQELHDEAGQALTALILELGQLKKEADDPQAVQARADELGSLAAGVLEDLHRLAMNLRPAALDHLGLVPALRQYAETIAEQQQITVQFEAAGIEQRLPEEIDIALYRITQEAVTNILRHAQASCVDILLQKHSSSIVLMVEDNGVGFAAQDGEREGHLGLLGMRERVEMLGGTLSIESAPGKGTTVMAEVPYKEP